MADDNGDLKQMASADLGRYVLKGYDGEEGVRRSYRKLMEEEKAVRDLEKSLEESLQESLQEFVEESVEESLGNDGDDGDDEIPIKQEKGKERQRKTKPLKVEVGSVIDSHPNAQRTVKLTSNPQPKSAHGRLMNTPFETKPSSMTRRFPIYSAADYDNHNNNDDDIGPSRFTTHVSRPKHPRRHSFDVTTSMMAGTQPVLREKNDVHESSYGVVLRWFTTLGDWLWHHTMVPTIVFYGARLLVFAILLRALIYFFQPTLGLFIRFVVPKCIYDFFGGLFAMTLTLAKASFSGLKSTFWSCVEPVTLLTSKVYIAGAKVDLASIGSLSCAVTNALGLAYCSSQLKPPAASSTPKSTYRRYESVIGNLEQVIDYSTVMSRLPMTLPFTEIAAYRLKLDILYSDLPNRQAIAKHIDDYEKLVTPTSVMLGEFIQEIMILSAQFTIVGQNIIEKLKDQKEHPPRWNPFISSPEKQLANTWMFYTRYIDARLTSLTKAAPVLLESTKKLSISIDRGNSLLLFDLQAFEESCRAPWRYFNILLFRSPLHALHKKAAEMQSTRDLVLDLMTTVKKLAREVQMVESNIVLLQKDLVAEEVMRDMGVNLETQIKVIEAANARLKDRSSRLSERKEGDLAAMKAAAKAPIGEDATYLFDTPEDPLEKVLG